MDELRLVRREDQSLIVATENGEEYRLMVDETVLAELRHLSRPSRGPSKINPRRVQALVRAGKTREEIALATGLEESDIERYEEPVLAERRYILELAKAVPVRTTPAEESEQEFGTVIAERLVGVSAGAAVWNSWRDEEAGWMIGLEFDSHEVAHRAVWTFDHRKGLLTPITGDATTLSKQGDLGERLIPKLRAVDAHERFDSGAFDVDKLRADADAANYDAARVDAASDDSGIDDSGSGDSARDGATDKKGQSVDVERESQGNADADTTGDAPDTPVSSNVAPDHPSTGAIPVVDAGEEYARRQHIEKHAIKSPERELPDLGETADLLDALRRRRGERESSSEPVDVGLQPARPIPISGGRGEASGDDTQGDAGEDTAGDGDAQNELVDFELLDGLEETRIVPRPGPRAVPRAPSGDSHDDENDSSPPAVDEEPGDANDAKGSQSDDGRARKRDGGSNKRGKGRASIPSWDDILFGTRSEDDPA